MEAFPTISDLAIANEEKVLRLWQGLGYYSRARNLHATAKYVHLELGGVFPSTYEDIIKLKGVGPYTAAAIASICFNEPTPVVDGNVFRFVSRYFGIEKDIAKQSTRKYFEEVLRKHIDVKHPGNFNQGLMEFGATQCSPAPKCERCVFQTGCAAFAEDLQQKLPVKSKKIKVRERRFHYLVFSNEGEFFLAERTGKDVWKGLYDFYLIEGTYSEEEILITVKEKFLIEDFIISDISEPMNHILSHQKITATFYKIELDYNSTTQLSQKAALRAYSIEEVLNLPKPKLIVNYLERIGINSIV